MYILISHWLIFASFLEDLELNRDFNGEDYEYEDEAKLVIFPDHFEIPLPNIEELPALVSELVLHGLGVFICMSKGKVHTLVPLTPNKIQLAWPSLVLGLIWAFVNVFAQQWESG